MVLVGIDWTINSAFICESFPPPPPPHCILAKVPCVVIKPSHQSVVLIAHNCSSITITQKVRKISLFHER